MTVAILINGNPIAARGCRNTQELNEKGEIKYQVDDGGIVWHKPSDGAVVLAIKLLKRITEL